MLCAHRLEAEGQFFLDLSCYFPGNTDTVRVGELFEPCGDVDTLAIAVVTLDDHLPEIDSDTHMSALVVRNVGVALGEAALQAHRAFDRIDHRAEFGEHAIAHQLEDVAVVARDLGLEQVLAPGRQPLMRPLLVTLHERGVADHVGGENGGELAFHGRAVLAATRRLARRDDTRCFNRDIAATLL